MDKFWGFSYTYDKNGRHDLYIGWGWIIVFVAVVIFIVTGVVTLFEQMQ